MDGIRRKHNRRRIAPGKETGTRDEKAAGAACAAGNAGGKSGPKKRRRRQDGSRGSEASERHKAKEKT
jgi:hypothetical protein